MFRHSRGSRRLGIGYRLPACLVVALAAAVLQASLGGIRPLAASRSELTPTAAVPAPNCPEDAGTVITVTSVSLAGALEGGTHYRAAVIWAPAAPKAVPAGGAVCRRV